MVMGAVVFIEGTGAAPPADFLLVHEWAVTLPLESHITMIRRVGDKEM